MRDNLAGQCPTGAGGSGGSQRSHDPGVKRFVAGTLVFGRVVTPGRISKRPIRTQHGAHIELTISNDGMPADACGGGLRKAP